MLLGEGWVMIESIFQMTSLVFKVDKFVSNIKGYNWNGLQKKLDVTELISNMSELVSIMTWLVSNINEYDLICLQYGPMPWKFV